MSETPRRDETERDSRLATLYRAAARDEPSPALDTAIRAAARREVGARPRPAGPYFSRSWRVPLSIAAVILLSVSLVTLIREEAPPEISQPPHAAAPLPLPEAATYPRKESVAADRTGAGEPPTPLAKRASPEAFPGVPVMRDNKVIAPAPLAAPAEASGQMAGAAVEPKVQPRAEAVSADADSAARESSRARVQVAPAPAFQSAPLVAGAIQPYVNLPPEKWLEQIETLRKQGRLEEAKTSLAAFRQRYPGHPLPASLKDGIKP